VYALYGSVPVPVNDTVSGVALAVLLICMAAVDTPLAKGVNTTV
jgi:hypothetical protein